MRWWLLLLFVGCAHDVHARFPVAAGSADTPTGTLVLRFSDDASGVSVAVNGVLVVEDAHTARVQIDGVPLGDAEVVLSAGGAEKAMRVGVGDAHPTTVPLGVPDGGGPLGFVKTIVASVVTVAVYALLH